MYPNQYKDLSHLHKCSGKIQVLYTKHNKLLPTYEIVMVPINPLIDLNYHQVVSCMLLHAKWNWTIEF